MALIIFILLGVGIPFLLVTPVGEFIENKTGLPVFGRGWTIAVMTVILSLIGMFYIGFQEDFENVNLTIERNEELQEMEDGVFYQINVEECKTTIVFLVNGRFYKKDMEKVIIEHGDVPQVIFYDREFKSAFNRAFDIFGLIAEDGVQYVKIIVP